MPRCAGGVWRFDSCDAYHGRAIGATRPPAADAWACLDGMAAPLYATRSRTRRAHDALRRSLVNAYGGSGGAYHHRARHFIRARAARRLACDRIPMHPFPQWGVFLLPAGDAPLSADIALLLRPGTTDGADPTNLQREQFSDSSRVLAHAERRTQSDEQRVDRRLF
jgi:hypothetical protein